MSEHYCKDCKNGEGDTCDFTGATHTTGIECPSFGAKEKEVEMDFRVRETDDSCNNWTVADGACYGTTDHYIQSNGTVVYVCKVYGTEQEAQNALDLYMKGQPETTGSPIRTFDSGATRDTAQGKLDYLKALSPIVLRRYVQYLDKHRLQPDGSYRDFDNWKKGIPQEVYISGGGRHFMDTWLLTEGYVTEDNHGPVEIEDAICAQLFNLMGRLHEMLRPGVVDRTAPVSGGY